jgi:hypothetical protein
MKNENRGIILTRELDNLARKGLNDVRAVFDGQMDNATLEKANMAIKLLRISSGRYSAETNRMALMFRVARAMDASPRELVPLWRQLAGGESADLAEKAIESATNQTSASATTKEVQQ